MYFPVVVDYKDKPKQKIVVEVLKLISPGAKYEYEQLSCICKGKVVDVENKFNNFLLDSNYDFSNEIMNSAYPQVNLDLHKVNDYFTKEQDKLSIETDIKDFNEVYSVFEMLLGFKDLSEEARMSLLYDASNTSRLTNIIYYTYYLMTQFYLYLLIHPGFSLSQPLTEDLLLFFRNYVDIKRLMKIAVVIVIKSTDTINNINDSDLKQQRRSAFKRAFASITKYAELFKQMVSNSQTFLSLLLFNIDSKRGDETDEEHLNMYDERLITLLEQFTRSFSTLYKINCDYSLLPYKEFYNDSLSKYLNIKYQCRIYNEILKKNYTGRKPFTLLSYIWLFDAAAKSDIFTEFNSNQQASEMLHVIRDMHNPLVLINAMDMQSMFLYIQVKRDKIIEDTLNYISNSSLNLKKQLKIKFIGEQGVDEGGVRKEFFMLLVRQIFDANYGMFSYNEKTRYFWFNLYSFEPKIKYELIGVLLGLAWFNSIILDVKFPLVIYKKLLGIPATLDDLKDCEPELYQTFTYLLNTNDDNLKDTLCMNFTVTVDKFGENVVIPLKEGGENIYIDQSNKHEYISLYLDWYFNKSIESYFVCFKNGFYRVCDSKLAHVSYIHRM